MPTDFSDAFRAITGSPPFPWQATLFAEILDGPPFRDACDLPTGLGKTSVITIWLLALAHHAQTGTLAGFPRRLVYIVNRQTVVDQATREAEKLRRALEQCALGEVRKALRSLAARQTDWDGRDLPPLAISTLRGEYADNAEWRDDPARAAVIVGTVDMIGSRLLFAGYGPGFKSRPLHAGFIGQDVLLVHDEAHLEPAFQELLEQIVREQERCGDFRRLHVMALSATARNGRAAEAPLLSDADRDNPVASRRLNARKTISFHPVEGLGVATKAAECALAYKSSNQAILVFVQRIEDVKAVGDRLDKEHCKVQRLTGTMRGRERDKLATDDPIFARFMCDSRAEPQGAVYLICTSAGEVGIDMSADHLICDLTPFDSMAQRLGRVNRFGAGEALIDVVFAKPGSDGEKTKKSPASVDYENARTRTLELLQSLKDRNASPAALMQLPAAERLAAFTPEPTILPATDILFDAWALTTVRDLPGRPSVADWLHGLAEWESPETHVAWREEVALIIGELAKNYPLEELLEDYPLKPHELLRDRYDRIFDQLKPIAERNHELPVWIVGDRGAVNVSTLENLIAVGKEALRFKTVILPPAAGGLGFMDDRSSGLLDGKCEYLEGRRDYYDVADEWRDADGNPRRCRLWDDATPSDKSMRLVRVIDTRPDDEERDAEEGADVASQPRFWRWYVRPRSADDEGSRTAREPQELRHHLRLAGDFADLIVAKLGLPEPEATAVRMAARWHDLGKNRQIWQRAVGNREYPQTVLAKSGGKMPPLDLNRYRHELGSLIDVQENTEFNELDETARDLVLHLIAAHHGRARPHFPAEEIFDPEQSASVVERIARETPQRFARLQRKYGRWGLAYLESLLRAADIMASQERLASDLRPGTDTAQ
jgi:CRISPR-associated endonuclease/helicase Cas3